MKEGTSSRENHKGRSGKKKERKLTGNKVRKEGRTEEWRGPTPIKTKIKRLERKLNFKEGNS